MELLVVLTIIAILASLAMPNLTKTHIKKRVKETVIIFTGKPHSSVESMTDKISNFYIMKVREAKALAALQQAVQTNTNNSQAQTSQSGQSQAITFGSGTKTTLKNTNYKQFFPKDNEEATFPKADKLFSKYMTKAEVEEGAIHIYFGNGIGELLNGKVLTLQPMFVANEDLPLEWRCGFADPIEGKLLAGTNRTNVPENFLPLLCTSFTSK